MELVQTQQQPPSIEQIREFVIAGHGNLDKVKQMLAENPQLLNASYQWNDNDRETAIQAAAQVGNAQVARYLLENAEPDIGSKNFQGKTPLMVATESKDEKIAQLLRAHGAKG